VSALDANNPELKFRNEAEVKAFSKFFLKQHPYESQFEFKTKKEWDEFVQVRERNLMAQLDNFKRMDFSKPNVTSVREKYYKIVPKRFTKPLSSIGSTKKSSRFNYKDAQELQNSVVYFGKTQACCEIEKHHLEYQLELMKNHEGKIECDDLDIIFNPIEESLVYEYNIDVEKILVLTSKPSCDAIGISLGAYRNEWFEINDLYEIPSASQILGSIARAQGYNGIMYTSVRQQTTPNLVIFEDNTKKLVFDKISEKTYVRSINL
jgi:hypothetical protein